MISNHAIPRRVSSPLLADNIIFSPKTNDANNNTSFPNSCSVHMNQKSQSHADWSRDSDPACRRPTWPTYTADLRYNITPPFYKRKRKENVLASSCISLPGRLQRLQLPVTFRDGIPDLPLDFLTDSTRIVGRSALVALCASSL